MGLGEHMDLNTPKGSSKAFQAKSIQSKGPEVGSREWIWGWGVV